jgi:hypothetical protein
VGDLNQFEIEVLSQSPLYGLKTDETDSVRYQLELNVSGFAIRAELLEGFKSPWIMPSES